MNPVEIEEAISNLAAEPFDPVNFPYSFLESFGNKAATLRRLKSGGTNQSDLEGGVLQRNNIHIKTCDEGQVSSTLEALRKSPATARHRAKFILATDGKAFEAENCLDGETIACDYIDFPEHFGFFLPLAGITTVKEIRENAFDIKATGRLNRLYVELIKENPDWDTDARRQELNHFFARLIFCFFAEDTNIFHAPGIFTDTIEQMTARDSSNTHEVLAELFRAMNTKRSDREGAKIRSWADKLPYVNGGLFSGSLEVPRFSKIARSYLLHVGSLDWTKINPDIFGSMIQAVAEEEERGALGMHYTSVPNILKVLNPLFLDELRAKLEEAGDNPRKLLNLRNRMARIRVFDPACGSGNFLVIAYKEMRAIEAEINRRRGEVNCKSDIPLTNFRGIELRSFAAEIARLALVIAEFQCDVLYRGQIIALAEVLPLEEANWITCGNALRLDWLSICPPTGASVKLHGDDLFSTPLDQTEIDFENEGGETYICGNPPYLGSTWQSKEQKDDLKRIFESRTKLWKSLDYVSGWFMKAADYGTRTPSAAAFVATNSICQGQQVAILWPLIFDTGTEIHFAHTSFKWSNLASHNAGVTVVIVGICNHPPKTRKLYSISEGVSTLKEGPNINSYLISGPNVIVEKRSRPVTQLAEMDFGSKPVDGGHLFLNFDDKELLLSQCEAAREFIREFSNSNEFINGKQRYCIWIEDKDAARAQTVEFLANRLKSVAEMRAASKKEQTRDLATSPHRFGEIRHRVSASTIVVPRVSSENRPYLPVGYLRSGAIVGDRNFALYDAPVWNLAVIASRLHWVWIGTVCVRMRTDFSYSNTLGWNTFPVPTLTEQNKNDLTQCAEEILLAREVYFPATIADLYDSEAMPSDLREAHERNDETLERIYIGRRFKNDTERLEKLFELYIQTTSSQAAINKESVHNTSEMCQ